MAASPRDAAGTVTSRPPLSAVIITRDAERLLDQVLAALAWCDETLVVDSGSTDGTVEIVHPNRIEHASAR